MGLDKLRPEASSAVIRIAFLVESVVSSSSLFLIRMPTGCPKPSKNTASPEPSNFDFIIFPGAVQYIVLPTAA